MTALLSGPRRRPPSQIHCGSIHAVGDERGEHEIVAMPAGPLQCWAVSKAAPRLGRPRRTQCCAKRRGGFLTCISHRRVEALAQELAAQGVEP